MKKKNLIKCKICNKEFESYGLPTFCSRKCYFESRKGKPWGGALNIGKGSHGKYSEYQVSQMAKAKSEAQFKRWRHLLVDNAEGLIEQYIEKNYISSIGYLTEKLVKEENRIAGKITQKILLKNGLLEKFKKTPKYPDSIQKLNLNQYDELISIIESKSWNDIRLWFMENNVSMHKFNEFWFKTKDFIKWYDKDIGWEIHNGKTIKIKNSWGKPSTPEKLFEKALKEFNINYKRQFRIDKANKSYFIYDFLIDDKLIVEINGDYWHGNPKLFPSPNEHQLKIQENDKIKKELAINLGYNYIVFWEHEIWNKHTWKSKFESVNFVKNKFEETKKELIYKLKEYL